MKQLLLLCLLLFSHLPLCGQSANEQIRLFRNLCEESRYTNVKAFTAYAERGLALTRQVNDQAAEADFLRYRGISYEMVGMTDSAVVCYEKGIEQALRTNNKECEALIYKSLGRIHLVNSQYKDNEKSLEYYLKSLQYFEKTGDKRNIALSFCSLGGYHRMIKNIERAGYYLQQAKALAEANNDDVARVAIYYNLAETADDIDESIRYGEEALAISRRLGDKRSEVFNLQSLGYNYCLEKHQYDIAERYATESLRVAEEYGESGSLICAWTVLSFVYLYQQRFEECKTMVLNAWHADSLNVQLSTLTNLAAAYLYSGQFDEAHAFFVKYVYQMEENAGRQYQKVVANMETLYQTEQKEMRIATLEKERRLYIWLGVAGILLALALAVGLWQKILSARKERQLIAANAVQDGEMGERARLASDLHDRLSGSLSAVKIQLNNAESLQLVSDRLDKCIEEIRRITHNLMPRSLQFGLRVALADFAAQLPNVQFHFFGEEKRIRERLEFVIYCCANELVTNALRYSGANAINIQLVQSEKHITLTVQDDGCGFDEKAVAKGIGLKNIRDRVASCNGKLDITSSPGQGTETTIELKTDKQG